MHNFKVNDFHREKPRGWKGSKSMGLFLFGSRDTCTGGSVFTAETGRSEELLGHILAWRTLGLPREECPTWERVVLPPAVPEEATSISKDLARDFIFTTKSEAPAGHTASYSTDPAGNSLWHLCLWSHQPLTRWRGSF